MDWDRDTEICTRWLLSRCSRRGLAFMRVFIIHTRLSIGLCCMVLVAVPPVLGVMGVVLPNLALIASSLDACCLLTEPFWAVWMGAAWWRCARQYSLPLKASLEQRGSVQATNTLCVLSRFCVLCRWQQSNTADLCSEQYLLWHFVHS